MSLWRGYFYCRGSFIGDLTIVPIIYKGRFEIIVLLFCGPSLPQGDMDAEEMLRIAATAHYLDVPESQTADLSKLADDLPEWVSAISWTAVYREWIF